MKTYQVIILIMLFVCTMLYIVTSSLKEDYLEGYRAKNIQNNKVLIVSNPNHFDYLPGDTVNCTYLEDYNSYEIINLHLYTANNLTYYVEYLNKPHVETKYLTIKVVLLNRCNSPTKND